MTREDIEIYDDEDLIEFEYQRQMKKIQEEAEADLFGEIEVTEDGF